MIVESKGIGSETEQITDLSEKSVACPAQVLEPELTWLFERRAIPEIQKGARYRTITEQPVGREFVQGTSGVEHAVYENWIAVSILEWCA